VQGLIEKSEKGSKGGEERGEDSCWGKEGDKKSKESDPP
jgi:hypothetical protein